MLQIKYICLLLILCLNAACSRHALHDAQTIVAQADSLWHEGKMYGIDHGDSTSLAQAYETLGKFSLPFREGLGLGPSYTHACYHYGRLLRKKDDPVSAMQVFINATHSHTRDYHILGRIYSNMGSICHSADEYAMAYDMYEISSNFFLQGRDSLLYYYGLNNMAFEKAMLADKNETLFLIEKIENQCTYTEVLSKICETKAELFLRTQQYDSALYYVSRYDTNEIHEPLGLLIKAQAYSYLSEKDSAVYFAKQVLLKSHNLSQINNAQYILTNDDISQGVDNIREVAADRADTQKLLEIQYGKSKQATQLLQQDLNRKPDFKWLYATGITILLIGSFLLIYLRRKRRQHLLLSQQVEELANKTNEMKQEHINYTNNLISQLDNKCRLFVQTDDLAKQLCWNDYDQMSRMMDEHFFMLATKLQNLYLLSEKEIRLCVLVLLGVNTGKQLSEMLFYSESGIRNFKNRTAKKLGTNSTHLRETILKIAVSGEQKSPE